MFSYKNDKVNPYLIGFFLLAITFAVFIPSLSLHFVDWDDAEYIYKNPNLAIFSHHWSWSTIYTIFTSKVGANYNPLPVVTYAVEKYFVASDPQATPFIFHFDNLLLHLCCTLCVFILFIKMGLSRTAAFIGALLFGIHPMRVESVSWITERKDVLYGFFYLLSLITYTNYIKFEQKTKWYILTLFFSLFAYFSKIQAVSLPLSMITLDFYFNRKWYLTKILLNEKLPWWILSIVIGLVNLHYLNVTHVINSGPQLGNYTLIDKLAVGAYSYLVYVAKFLYPYQMVHWYIYPVKLPVIAYCALCILPIVSLILLYFIRKNIPLIFGWLFFTVNVIFLLQVVPSGNAFLADRFTYIAYVGLFFVLAVCYEWADRYLSKRRAVLIILLSVYLILFSIMTVEQEKVWRNTFTLWTHYIHENPKSIFGYIELGSFCVSELEASKKFNLDLSKDELKINALKNFTIANGIDSLGGRQNKGSTLLIFEGLGTYYAHLNMFDSAAYYFSRQVTIVSQEVADDPADKDVYADRALTYYKNKKYGLALSDYRKFLKFDPSNDGAYYRCALCEGYLGLFRDGVTDINKAISLDSTQADYYFTRSKLYRLMNVVDSARTDAQKAKKMGANVADKWLL